MTWSSAGSAATFPTLQPPGKSLQITSGNVTYSWFFTSTLTFRLDPQSAICYLTGSITFTNNGANYSPEPTWPNFLADPLPPQFRPRAAVKLIPTFDSGNTSTQPRPLLLAADGTLSSYYNAGSSGQGEFRTFYFTDTTPA